MKNTALILLSTFNGEKFLASQLESIRSQTFTDWILLVRDDGSSDKTVSIIKNYCQTDKRIILLEDQLGNLNIFKSFSTLMQQAVMREEQYIFFSDQDDIWLPDKLERQTALLSELEKQHGTETPLLVHSDLAVVDGGLQEIHPSYLQFEKLQRNTLSPVKTLLINNFVTGCTVGMNRRLLEIATPIPDSVYMHDWWCALCAAVCGKIGFTEEATLLYRQHHHNSIGSNGFYGKFKELLSLRKSFVKKKKNLGRCFGQAKSLLGRVGEGNQYYSLVEGFSSLINKQIFKRYYSAARLGLQPAGKLRGMLFWFFLCFV